MLTARGWWFFLLSLSMVVFAGAVAHTSLTRIGMTLLLWFIGQWLLFQVRTYRIRDRLSIERELHDERGPVSNLWARRTFEVRLRVRLQGRLGLSYLRVTERVPFGVEQAGGET